MKLTKYDHACFTVEDGGKVLVVDPGNFAADFIAPENVVAVVVTHKHADHFDSERLAEIFDKNDEMLVLGPREVIDQVEIENKRVVEGGESTTIGPFELEFFGGTHATIHDSIPLVQNLGVLVGGLIYYPGDSFIVPGVPIDTLALPITAPWLKVSETIDFLLAIRPRLAFPTHDAIASSNGKTIIDRRLTTIAEQNDIVYKRLDQAINV